MERAFAEYANQSILEALKKMHSVVMAMKDLEFPEKVEYEKSLGILIGEIQVRLLEPIVTVFPDLDDLANLR